MTEAEAMEKQVTARIKLAADDTLEHFMALVQPDQLEMVTQALTVAFWLGYCHFADEIKAELQERQRELLQRNN